MSVFFSLTVSFYNFVIFKFLFKIVVLLRKNIQRIWKYDHSGSICIWSIYLAVDTIF